MGKNEILETENLNLNFKEKEQEQNETKATFRANIQESDLHWHACEIIDILADIREFPEKYVENMESLKTQLFDLKSLGKLDPCLPSEDQIEKTKELLSSTKNKEVDSIMWKDKLFHALKKRLKDFDPDNSQEILLEIRNSFPNLKIFDFTLHTDLSNLDTILMIISKSEENFNLLVNQNYHYAAAIVGVNSYKLPVTKILLANEIISL